MISCPTPCISFWLEPATTTNIIPISEIVNQKVAGDVLREGGGGFIHLSIKSELQWCMVGLDRSRSGWETAIYLPKILGHKEPLYIIFPEARRESCARSIYQGRHHIKTCGFFWSCGKNANGSQRSEKKTRGTPACVALNRPLSLFLSIYPTCAVWC